MPILFTYGTLKRGFQNEPLLADQNFLGKAVLATPKWLLYEVRGNYSFPALVPGFDGYQVYGELYEVSDKCLAVLDRLEGVNVGLYARVFVEVLLSDGRLVEEVIAYRFLRDTKDCHHGHRLCTKESAVMEEGVALWSKRHSNWATGIHKDENELRKACVPKRNKFGARVGQDEAWSPQWFEVRSHKSVSPN